MLTSKSKLACRFFFCWLVPSLLFSWAWRIEQHINFRYKIGNDWWYALNNPWTVGLKLFGFVFFLICLCYFFIPKLFKFQLKNYSKFVYTTFTALVIIFVLSMNSFGSNQNLLSSFRPLIVIALMGVSVPLIDNLVQKMFRFESGHS